MKKQSDEKGQDETAIWAGLVGGIISLLMTAVMGLQQVGGRQIPITPPNACMPGAFNALTAALTQLSRQGNLDCPCEDKIPKQTRFEEDSLTDQILDPNLKEEVKNARVLVVSGNPFETDIDVEESFVFVTDVAQTDITYDRDHFKLMFEDIIDHAIITTHSPIETSTQIDDLSFTDTSIQTDLSLSEVGTEPTVTICVSKDIQVTPSSKCVCIQKSANILEVEVDEDSGTFDVTDMNETIIHDSSEFRPERRNIEAPEVEDICICEDGLSSQPVSHTVNDSMYRSYESKGLDSTLKIKRICKIIPEPVPQTIIPERFPDRPIRTVNCPQYYRACPAVAYRTQVMGINPVPPRPLPPYYNVRPQVRYRHESPPPPFSGPEVCVFSKPNPYPKTYHQSSTTSSLGCSKNPHLRQHPRTPPKPAPKFVSTKITSCQVQNDPSKTDNAQNAPEACFCEDTLVETKSHKKCWK